MNILQTFKEYCETKQYSFTRMTSVKSPNDETFFKVTGIETYISFLNDQYFSGTITDCQRCLRITDISSIGKNHNLATFDILGLSSFRDLTIEQVIGFWLDFLASIGIYPDRVTIPVEKIEWLALYNNLSYSGSTEIRNDCLWDHISLSGCCTEFFVGEVEIGSIVCLGDTITSSFGLQRLNLVSENRIVTRKQNLIDTVESIVSLGINPSGKAHGYILRELLKAMILENVFWDHPIYEKELSRLLSMHENYLKFKDDNVDKDVLWWKITHGVDLEFSLAICDGLIIPEKSNWECSSIG